MSAPIGPGDFVECINSAPRNVPGFGLWGIRCPLRVGAVYCVERLIQDDPFGEDGVTLVGVQAPPPSEGFWVGRFRPIYRPKASLIEGLRQPVSAEPERVSA